MTSSPNIPSDRDILQFMTLFSRLYLASGGPTSRLEDNLNRLGVHYGRETEVYATPTGVFVTLNNPNTDADPVTALSRIRETGTDLGQLCQLENTLAELRAGRITLRAASISLTGTTELYSATATACAALGAGFVASYSSYQRIEAAALSGLIATVVWLLIRHVLKREVSNPVLSDFIAAFLTLVLAATAHAFAAPLAIEAYAIGGIVMLVPGLALTASIAELAEQNIVSGTAKFMQASLALLALGLAYLLFQQIAYSLDLLGVLQPMASKRPNLLVSAAGVLLNTCCFGMLFKVPPKALVWSTLTGLAGWAALAALGDTSAAAAGPYLASLAVGLASLGFGRFFGLPSQVYSVPGIVAMLPGMLALSSVRYFASGDQDMGITFTFEVAVTAVSIVFGLMTARIPFSMGERILRGIPLKRREPKN